jgi:hypothetical protein
MPSNTTTTTTPPDFLAPFTQEAESINYQWVALESLSDLLCVLLALYVGLPGLRKIWPYHEGYAGAKKGFIWLAARWGVGDYPHLFRTVIGMVELSVFLGCFMCFLPGPTSQLITCLSLIAGMGLCIPFFITHAGDPWRQRIVPLRQFAQAGLALAIRLYQDFDWSDQQAVALLYSGAGCVGFGVLYMIYRRARFGKLPDPLLG